jgi:hypothetical protein
VRTLRGRARPAGTGTISRTTSSRHRWGCAH